MPLLIDGYNLLHATGLFGSGKSSLEASRNALLGFLAAALPPDDRAHTIVVFDAAEAPPGLPDHYQVYGIDVRYARDYESADALLEALIAAHHAPRKLTVVSSDHRVQRAAKKRRANAVDSHVWYQAAASRMNQRKSAADAAELDRDRPPAPGEVEAWLNAFGPVDIPSELLETLTALPSPEPSPKRRLKKPTKTRKAASVDSSKETGAKTGRIKRVKAPRPPKKRSKPLDLGFGDLANPFPPGYAEDAAREE